jgi:hypothetical protein
VLEEITAVRYVAPLREGGSLPGVVEADDLGTYVVKFSAAGQGTKSLAAEVIVGELARRLGLPVPELRLIDFGIELGRSEPDPEVQDLLVRSAGLNLAMEFLPGALGYDPRVHKVDADLASRVLWLDAFVENVDRTWRNPNLLMWHRGLWLIDHGASLYFHHNWASAPSKVLRPFGAADHVLAGYATRLPEADDLLRPRITPALLDEIMALVPPDWLDTDRATYAEHLLARVADTKAWLPA